MTVDRVERDCIHALYRHGRPSSVIGMTVGAVVVAVLWGRIPAPVLAGWYALVFANQCLRLALVAAFFRENPQGERIATWARRYQWTMVVGGALYGSIVVALWPDDYVLGQLFLIITVDAMAAGSIAANAFHAPTMMLYLAAILVVSPFRLAFAGVAEYGWIAFSQALYTVVMLGFGRNQVRLIRESIASAHRNADLVEELREKTAIAEAAQRKAEEASLAKSQFFAAASHDLRQPLHALGLHAAALRHARREPAEQRQYEQILTSVDALESLFDELLDISKLDAGQVRVEERHIPVEGVFARASAVWDESARGAGLALRFAPTRAVVRTDPVLLERILDNLLSNALRYTREGGALVAARRRAGAISIEVWDTGLGIAPEFQGRVFDEFFQLGNPGRDRKKGLGLGLATVRRMANLLGTTIELRSRSGRGSVFRVLLPAGDAAKVAVDAAPAEPARDLLPGRRIAVIEDEAEVRAGMTALLEQWGCVVVAAASESETLVALDGVIPDLVIADYRLRDGLTGIAAIRGVRGRYARAIPALLVTGDSSPERFREAQAEGLPLLNKPVRAVRLRAVIQHLLSA